MTIEHAARQLAEAVKTVSRLIKDDATCIHIDRNGINVHVLDKEVFRALDSEQTHVDWHSATRSHCKITKLVGRVNFYTLINVQNEEAVQPTPPIPPETLEKAMNLIRRDSGD